MKGVSEWAAMAMKTRPDVDAGKIFYCSIAFEQASAALGVRGLL